MQIVWIYLRHIIFCANCACSTAFMRWAGCFVELETNPIIVQYFWQDQCSCLHSLSCNFKVTWIIDGYLSFNSTYECLWGYLDYMSHATNWNMIHGMDCFQWFDVKYFFIKVLIFPIQCMYIILKFWIFQWYHADWLISIYPVCFFRAFHCVFWKMKYDIYIRNISRYIPLTVLLIPSLRIMDVGASLIDSLAIHKCTYGLNLSNILI